MRTLRRRATVVALVPVLAVLAACSSSPRADALLDQPVPSHATVATRDVAGLGTVVVDGDGKTLYMFPPDASQRVTCTGACAGTWPPFTIADGHRPNAGAGVAAAHLSTLPDPNTGARVVTYYGHPLYRYAGDLSAGVANGQALFNDGGPWYVLNADGRPVVSEPAAQR